MDGRNKNGDRLTQTPAGGEYTLCTCCCKVPDAGHDYRFVMLMLVVAPASPFAACCRWLVVACA
jgi:hypothetical protein